VSNVFELAQYSEREHSFNTIHWSVIDDIRRLLTQIVTAIKSRIPV